MNKPTKMESDSLVQQWRETCREEVCNLNLGTSTKGLRYHLGEIINQIDPILIEHPYIY